MEARKSNFIKGLGGFAEYLGVHRQTIYNWKKKGLLKYKEIGRIILFDPEDYLKEDKREEGAIYSQAS